MICVFRCTLKAESLFSPGSTSLPKASHIFKTSQKDSAAKSALEDWKQRQHKQERMLADDLESHDQHKASFFL